TLQKADRVNSGIRSFASSFATHCRVRAHRSMYRIVRGPPQPFACSPSTAAAAGCVAGTAALERWPTCLTSTLLNCKAARGLTQRPLRNPLTPYHTGLPRSPIMAANTIRNLYVYGLSRIVPVYV